MLSELSHYGIKGMKWGVRRYQDYDGRLTSAGRQRVKDERVNKTIERYIASGKAKIDELSSYSVGNLSTMITKTGEKYISGLMNGHDFQWQEVTKFSGDLGDGFRPVATVIKEEIERGREPWKMTDEESVTAHSNGIFTNRDIQTCNPGFGNAGTTQNCAKCSATMELKLRGYDISAGRQSYPSSVDSQSFWFKDAKRIDYDYDASEEALRSYGPMTSGTLSYRYPGNAGGHAVHWSNDKYGRFEIQDGQNGRRFDSLSEMMDAYGGDKKSSISTYRLDNCEPDWDNMASDSVVRLSGEIRGESWHKVKNRITNRVVDRW